MMVQKKLCFVPRNDLMNYVQQKMFSFPPLLQNKKKKGKRKKFLLRTSHLPLGLLSFLKILLYFIKEKKKSEKMSFGRM